jgi:hypothetical protein
MAAITTSVNRQRRGQCKTRRYLMAVSTAIPKGALVGILASSGLAVNAVSGATITAPAVGVAAETVTSPASGNTYIEVEFDADWLFAASSIAQTAVGVAMLVVDNNTIDETSASSAVVGKLVEFVSSTSGWVNIPGLSA